MDSSQRKLNKMIGIAFISLLALMYVGFSGLHYDISKKTACKCKCHEKVENNQG